MSTRTNRQRLNKAVCSRDYRLILLKFEYPPYWDEGVYYRKGQFSHKYREHKTWKYNRKTQYKNNCFTKKKKS